MHRTKTGRTGEVEQKVLSGYLFVQSWRETGGGVCVLDGSFRPISRVMEHVILVVVFRPISSFFDRLVVAEGCMRRLSGECCVSTCSYGVGERRAAGCVNLVVVFFPND